MVNVSAWLALDDVDEENSCVQLIPGSQRETVPHVELPADAHHDFPLRADPARYREQDAVSMVMQAGECFLFTERTLHRSSANRSARRRAALTIRVTATSVRVRHPEAERVILLRGVDRYGHNRIVPPPA
jgi:ectoine hydroxylase-related dioxygenase (phytanoyl-CoA dioxygenase family)